MVAAIVPHRVLSEDTHRDGCVHANVPLAQGLRGMPFSWQLAVCLAPDVIAGLR